MLADKGTISVLLYSIFQLLSDTVILRIPQEYLRYLGMISGASPAYILSFLNQHFPVETISNSTQVSDHRHSSASFEPLDPLRFTYVGSHVHHHHLFSGVRAAKIIGKFISFSISSLLIV